MIKSFLVLVVLVFACSVTAMADAKTSVWYVGDFGAKADGQTDDTAAFQQALDAASKAGGGIVHAARGNYFFAGHLNVPSGVTLEGVWQSVPSHAGFQQHISTKPTDNGTTFLITENAGNENGTPFIQINEDSTLKGVALFYPNQIPDDVPIPYPYAIAMTGNNAAVLQVELLNPYNGIYAVHCPRHLIRDVQGQPLRRGIYVDAIYDIGRIEDVHFNPWWSWSKAPKLSAWQRSNGEAFIFGRADWEYVFNTFCYGYRVGYKFIKTKNGVDNGNFLGIGADQCASAVEVEDLKPWGLLISNGEFTSVIGPDPTMVRVKASNSGSVRFVSCAFWGPCNHIARIAGRGTVGFGDCTFAQWGEKNKDLAAIQAESGSLLVRGCEFQQNKPQIQLGEAVRRAVITGNIFTGKVRIINNSKGQVVINDNAGD